MQHRYITIQVMYAKGEGGQKSTALGFETAPATTEIICHYFDWGVSPQGSAIIGRRAKPISTHKKSGTYRKDRHKGPELEVQAPQMPPDLLPKAQAAWNVIVMKLMEAGLVADLDQLALRMLSESVELYLDACDLIREQGLVAGGGDSGLYQHPAVGIRNKAWAQIVKLCGEFGLTPAARVGLHLEAKQPNTDEVARLLGLNVIR